MATSTSTASPGRVDVPRREVDLEPAHPGQGARGSADLGREVGEGGEVVAEQGGRVGELAARDLHAVAGVAAEPDDGLLDRLLLLVAPGGTSVLVAMDLENLPRTGSNPGL